MCPRISTRIFEAREVVRRSFPVEEYQPRDTLAWDEAYERFLGLVKTNVVGG